MTIQEIRLECYREAVIAERTRPGIKKTAEEIVEGFFDFTGADTLRLTALKMALQAANPRAPLEGIIADATALVEFAACPPPLPPPPARLQRSPTKRGRR